MDSKIFMSYCLIQLMIIMYIILTEMKHIMVMMETFGIGVRIVQNGVIMILLGMLLGEVL
jgi:hypothetical protein